MGQILCIALALIVGLLSSRLMKLVKMPNVTGYLLAGIIFGPYVLGKYIGGWGSNDQFALSSISWISDIALGFIAFTIGNSFSLKLLKQTGVKDTIVTIFESFGGGLFVAAALLIAWTITANIPSSPIQIPLPVVLVLAAIACATAPAATVLVIKQYRAHGPVCDTLLPVVALDDAVALIAFSILFSISKTIAKGTGTVDFIEILLIPFLEILFSLIIGSVIGILIALITKWFKSRANRIAWILAAVLGIVGITYILKENPINGYAIELSPLLCAMMCGAFFINMSDNPVPTLQTLDRATNPLYILFFVISGASLNITAFLDAKLGWTIIIIVIIYVMSRSLGKWVGAYYGCSIAKLDPVVKKYLGWTLFPQAGVAIGLATTASNSLAAINSDIASLILPCVLTSTLIYELIGPLITKTVLTKAGEITNDTKSMKAQTDVK